MTIHSVLLSSPGHTSVPKSRPFKARHSDASRHGAVTRCCRAHTGVAGHFLAVDRFHARSTLALCQKCSSISQRGSLPTWDVFRRSDALPSVTPESPMSPTIGYNSFDQQVPYQADVGRIICLWAKVRVDVVGICPSRWNSEAGRHPQGGIAKQENFPPPRVMRPTSSE
jgi:hypothetical protein